MIRVIQGDITKVTGFDAIVNPANNSLLGGGGLDGMIHRVAGPQLKTECRRLNGCETGDSKLTLGYNLPCEYVIHSVGPIWMGGTAGEAQLLTSCYTSALRLASENYIRKIAFASISTGEYGYPMDKAAKLAVAAVSAFVADHPDAFDDICWVIPDDLGFNIYSEEIKNSAPIVKKEEVKKKAPKKGKKASSKNNSDEVIVEEPLEEATPEPVTVEMPPDFPAALYNKYHIDWLIDEISNGNEHTYVSFFLAEKTSELCQLSLWYQGSPIFINGRKFDNAQQYIMCEKALLFGDFNSYAKIFNESDPAICKKLGEDIKGFDESIWKKCYREIIFNGNVGKFLSDKAFADALLSTGDAVIIEASPNDDLLGAGLDKDDLLSADGTLKIPPQNWHKEDSDFQAKNELGFILMAVREFFQKTNPRAH